MVKLELGMPVVNELEGGPEEAGGADVAAACSVGEADAGECQRRSEQGDCEDKADEMVQSCAVGGCAADLLV